MKTGLDRLMDNGDKWGLIMFNNLSGAGNFAKGLKTVKKLSSEEVKVALPDTIKHYLNEPSHLKGVAL